MLNTDHDHSPEGIAARLSRGPSVHYLREWVYGGIDGVVTTFAVVAAVIGADLPAMIVLIMGAANIVGDGFSMAAGSYSSSKAEADNYERLKAIETSHIQKHPEGEKEETRQLLAAKGVAAEDIEAMTDMLSRDEALWIDFMLTEEYGVSRPSGAPLMAAFHTFLAFVVCGTMPLLPFALGFGQPAIWALALSALTFFAIGSSRSLWSIKSWWSQGMETMAIGLSAAGLSFLIGYGLQGLIGTG